ncbi:DUF4878 domain-containing protein [Cardiobacterium valvarum]|uniref:DUF4878 domain-containing protein n=1 Tax=Cardiobacterium valvarum F0432 TaxID=797473 RepID=G9ZBG7_9GAMM|nr:DUF4878 domain-containing protein [Cardiobacterium valvarum]EHM56117.1 hypothetical protein HMPREF9080_00090 [Cardiobacterium valvarum F0432]
MKTLIQTLTLVFFAAILTACGESKDKEAEAAQKITQAFFDELFQGDPAKAAGYLAIPPEAKQAGLNEETARQGMTMVMTQVRKEAQKEGEIPTVQVGKVTYTNAAKSEAKIAVTLYKHINGKKARRDAEILLIKEDGVWKVLKPDT